jgi:predicted NAD/FAD-binding protein
MKASGTRRTTAVIGGGVAGIVAAHLLQDIREVTVFEAADYLGGHTHTVSVPDGPEGGTPVDTGFIVFNEATYPLFIRFLDELGVASREAEMSFGFHCEGTGLTYAGTDLNGLFVQRRNMVSPRYWRFLFEIARFCRQAKDDLEAGEELGTLDEYVRSRRYSPFMVENYLLPMAAAIWSTPAGRVGRFPALSFLRFFRNHGLLSLVDRPRWRTVSGGSCSYVRAFLRRFSGTVRLNSPVARVLRTHEGVRVEVEGEGPQVSTRSSSPPTPTRPCACWATRRRKRRACLAHGATRRTGPSCTPTSRSCRGSARPGPAGTSAAWRARTKTFS